MLVGRRAERQRIDALLSTARSGASGLLVLRGDAGIGKSALVEYAREQARGLTQLRAQGVESEAELAFAGLTELLGPVTKEVATLPAPQAEALQSALALNSEPANPLAVRVALHTLLVSLAESTPVLVTVDDAQWVDESSLEALAFAVRRLTVEPVVVIAAVRGERRIPLGNGHVPPLVLNGLAEVDARELLGRVPGSAGPRPTNSCRSPPATRWRCSSCRRSSAAVPRPRVSNRRRSVHASTAAFRVRLDRLPTARLAVGVVAADGVAGLARVPATRSRRSGCHVDALQPAEHAGLVTIEGDRVCAAASAAAAGRVPRADAARAAAKCMPRSPARSRGRASRAAHVAPGRGRARPRRGGCASRSTRSRGAAERRGALRDDRARLRARASLSTDDDDRARRLLAGADAWLAAGHWEPALDQLDRPPRTRSTRASGPTSRRRPGSSRPTAPDPRRAAQILVEAADEIEADDPGAGDAAAHLRRERRGVRARQSTGAVALARPGRGVRQRAGGLNVDRGCDGPCRSRTARRRPDRAGHARSARAAGRSLIESDLADAEHVF